MRQTDLDSTYEVKVSGDTLRRIRDRLYETQETFGRRFGVTKRTMIRWEQHGTKFRSWHDKADAWRTLSADPKFGDILTAAEKRPLWER